MSGEEADGHWVFGYGSLMWRPGFEFAEQRRALVRGWSRRLCIYSHVYRGTPEHPGLVLGLDRGGSCFGVAFRVESRRWTETLAYLRARELVTTVYEERRIQLEFGGAQTASGLAYTADRRHGQYAGRLDRARLLAFVRDSRGEAGANVEYIFNTQAHLATMGIADADLDWLAATLRDIAAQSPGLK